VLVYLKESMGCSIVNGHRVCGRFYARGSFGPTNMPRATFLKNKSVLEEIEITPSWLFQKTGKIFPIGFKTTELPKLEFDVVIDIAKSLGIEYIKSRKPSGAEESALRRTIIRVIDLL
jgi:hypothetical protein